MLVFDDFKPTRKLLPPDEGVGESVKKHLPDPDLNIVMDEKDHIVEAFENVETNDDESEVTSNNSSNLRSRQMKIKNKKTKISVWWNNLSTKKKWLFIGFCTLVLALLAVGGYFTYKHFNKVKPVSVQTGPIIKKTTPTINTVASRLTGIQVTPDLANMPVTAVMIENSLEARPQSGLSEAGIVFEAQAEGGITRFMALYEEGQPSSLGPVRSARPYFIDWMLPYDAPYSHVGGSPDALTEIQTLGVKDLNEFYNGSYYERISQRAAPHNVYTSMSNLLTLEKSKGWTSSNFTGWPRKKDLPSKTPNATSIDLSEGSPDYDVHYDYAAKTNSYLRSEGGSSMVDANTNQQLNPKVVVAMVVPLSSGALDASGAYYSDYQDVGSGTVYIFQDGILTQGTWNKPTQASAITFTSASGTPINLNAGQTWVTVVSSTSAVSYK